jgi:hypothetical protein
MKEAQECVIENNAIKMVGDWILATLSPAELRKIIEHKGKVLEPDSALIINVRITLFELDSLQKFGILPHSRDCFEIKK